MKITNFGKTEHRLLSSAITAALKAVGEEFGVDLVAGGGQVGASGGRVNVEVKVLNGVSTADIDRAEWDRKCGFIGLSKGLHGQTFIANRELYRITGLNLGRPKFPVTAERVGDKKPFKFPASTILANFSNKIAA